jgi:transcriptional regulator with PAS, ATPase and Fis domain
MEAQLDLSLAPPASQLRAHENLIVKRLLAQTPSLLPLAETLALATSHDVTVLLTGETGTGKTYLARLIHDCSPRRDERFLVVPCGALANNLLESELFGHVKGSFSGAEQNKDGKFIAAGRGTILLDEIDVLGLEQQVKLLRIVETGEFEPVGSNQTLECKARVIASSNINLEEAIRKGAFREDLFYRLNVLSFRLPPLRERREDIRPLVRDMLAGFSKKFDKEMYNVAPRALAILENHPWPGNIRQLENVVQQAVLAGSGPELVPVHLPPQVREASPGGLVARPPATGSLTHVRQANEREHIQRVLQEVGFSRARAAERLGVSRVTLYKKIKKYGLKLNPAAAPLKTVSPWA